MEAEREREETTLMMREEDLQRRWAREEARRIELEEAGSDNEPVSDISSEEDFAEYRHLGEDQVCVSAVVRANGGNHDRNTNL